MAPPLKASSNAGPISFIATCAMQTFAFTDRFMQINPQAPDNTAHTAKPMALVAPKK